MSSNRDIKRVVLIGAGGNIGSIILSALLQSKWFEVTVLTRPSSNSSFPTDVHVVKTAYTEAELAKVFQGQDAVVSAVGAPGFQEQKTFIDAAIKAGVQRFIPSEFSSNTLSNAVRQLVPVFEPKKQVLDYLKEKEATGLTWTGLSTGPLLDWGLRIGFLGFDIPNKKALIWDEGRVLFSATNAAHLGQAVVSILRHPAETANQFLYVSTVTTDHMTILKSLEAQTGHKWEVENVKTGDQVAKARNMVAEGDFTGMLMLVQASDWGAVEGIRSNFAVDEKLANETLGLPAEGSLDATVEDVLRSAKDVVPQ